MKFLQRVFVANLRDITRVLRSRRRVLCFETMEQRVVLSADLMAAGAAHELFHDDGGFELHALTVLPQAADPVNPEGTLSTVTPVNVSETFFLHSAPNAKHTIYLDFDGHVTSGTIWNSNYNGGQDIVTPAYDFDGNSTSFSNSELQRIQWIWERVAEDFIPFNVNVTTQDPGAAALSKSGSSDDAWGARMVIGGSSNDWWGSAAGGVAFVGSFNWSTDSPGFVFEAQLGNGNEKYTAEAISHEAGHMLGLSHDGRISPSEEYFAGHGSGTTGWAPIMGSSYNKNVTQWSSGEYASASQKQNDLAILSGNNGFTYRSDDHGNSIATASTLSVNNDSISDWGIIERTTDVDVFSFQTNAGSIQINADPLDRGPNLDLLLELLDASSNILATSNPTDLLSASITASVAAQQYFLRVSGVGKGDPLTNGYSDYASLGQYFLSGTVIPVQNDFISVSATDAMKSEGDVGSVNFTFAVTRSGNINGSTTVNYSVNGSGPNAAGANDFTGGILPSGSVTFAPGETSKVITVSVAGDAEVETDEGFTVGLSTASEQTILSQPSAVGLILNDDVDVVAGISVTPTSGLTTRENGTSATFDVVLDSQPTADVTIAVTSLDTTEGRTSSSLLRFTPSDWNTPQTVIVTGVDDALRDGNITYLIDLAAAQSSDGNYNNLNVDDVQVTNQDDERGGGKGGKGSKAADVPTFTSSILASMSPFTGQPNAVHAGAEAADNSQEHPSVNQETRKLSLSLAAIDGIFDNYGSRSEPETLPVVAAGSASTGNPISPSLEATDQAILELLDSLSLGEAVAH